MTALFRCLIGHPRWVHYRAFGGIDVCAWCEAERGSRRHP